MYDEFDGYDDCDEWDSWDEVIYDSLRDMHVDEDILNCSAYYGRNSHISIGGGQAQPLDDELFQPADLLELFRNVSVTHMTEHLEDAIYVIRDATIALKDDCKMLGGSVVCGRLELRFPAIPASDLEHYLESVK